MCCFRYQSSVSCVLVLDFNSECSVVLTFCLNAFNRSPSHMEPRHINQSVFYLAGDGLQEIGIQSILHPDVSPLMKFAQAANSLHVALQISNLSRDFYTPTTKCGGAILDSLCRVGRSVGRSVSNSCPLYNSFTNGRIAFKLE